MRRTSRSDAAAWRTGGLGRDEREADRSQPNRRLRASTDTRPHDVGHLDFLASTQVTPGSGQRSHEMAAITGKKILVVGASGFLGRPLTARLAAAGAKICAVCRNPPKAGAANVFWSRGDAIDANDSQEMFSSFRPAVVFH